MSTSGREALTFEQQVAEALREAPILDPNDGSIDFGELAPRVAAAIERGAERAIAPWAAAMLPGDLQTVREAALAALRGKP